MSENKWEAEEHSDRDLKEGIREREVENDIDNVNNNKNINSNNNGTE